MLQYSTGLLDTTVLSNRPVLFNITMLQDDMYFAVWTAEKAGDKADEEQGSCQGVQEQEEGVHQVFGEQGGSFGEPEQGDPVW